MKRTLLRHSASICCDAISSKIQILNKNYQAAANTLKGVKNADATTFYLAAILNARTGNNAEAAQALQKAIAKDPTLAEYAAKDLELVNIKK